MIKKKFPYKNKDLYDVIVTARAKCDHKTQVVIFGPSINQEQLKIIYQELKTQPCSKCSLNTLI